MVNEQLNIAKENRTFMGYVRKNASNSLIKKKKKYE